MSWGPSCRGFTQVFVPSRCICNCLSIQGAVGFAHLRDGLGLQFHVGPVVPVSNLFQYLLLQGLDPIYSGRIFAPA